MNRILIFLLLFASMMLFSQRGNAQANAIDTYFQNYVEDERFTVVYLSPRLFKLFEDFGREELDLDDQEADALTDMIKDLRGLRILNTDTLSENFYREAVGMIDTKLYEPLMTIRSKGGGKTELSLRENGAGNIIELLLMSFDEDDFTLISFVGNLDLNKVMRLADELDDDN